MADYGPLYQSAGQQWNIDPLLLQSIAQQESGQGQNLGPSSAGAKGFMQFLPQTAAKYGVNVNDATSSVMGAAHYMDDLLQYYGGDLNAALSAYGGDTSGKAGYAQSVVNRYRQLRTAWSPQGSDDAADTASMQAPTSGDVGGIKITAHALPGPGGAQQGGASFVPPPGTPDTLGRSNQPGSRAAHPMQASEYGSNAAPEDFTTQLFGPEPAPATQQPPQGQQQPPAPSPAPAPATPDFTTQLFGPTGTAGVTPQPDRAPATDVTIPSASPGPMVTPPQPSWLQTNVVDPVRAMYDPTTAGPMSYFLGQPLLQNIGAGIFQGPRNVAQRANEWEQGADQNYPWLANLDRSVGETPEVLAARGKQLAAQTQAYRTQYGNSLAAAGGELAGNLLTTYPLAAAVGWGLGALGEAVPLLRGATEVANAAGTPAAQNILTTPGQDWRTAGEQGAAGGVAVHGLLGSVGGQFANKATTQAQQDAERLGFNLTRGEYGNPYAKNVEGISAYLPGSGAAAKEAEHRAVINTVLNRNMGMGESPVLNQATLQTARAHAGSLMDQIQGVTVDANKDPNLLNELGNIHAEATAQPMTGTSVTGAVDKVLGSIDQNGMLTGDVLHNLIKNGAPLDNLISSRDPVVSQFAQRIKTALLDAASRGDDPAIYGATQAARNRVAVDAFNQGRYNWKVIKTVEPLVDKTGSGDDVTYQGLASRIEGNARSGNPNFDPRFPGANHDMDALARVLRGPLAQLKSSGTGRELLTAGALKTLVGEGGLGAGLAAFAPENFNSYLAAMAPTLATIGAGRLFRYGPSMGNPLVQAARIEFNPLAPRAFGPAVATNPLLNPPQQQGQ